MIYWQDSDDYWQRRHAENWQDRQASLTLWGAVKAVRDCLDDEGSFYLSQGQRVHTRSVRTVVDGNRIRVTLENGQRFVLTVEVDDEAE